MNFQESLQIALITIAITFLANLIFHYLKNYFDWFSETKIFKRDHYYSQLKELYLELYGVVSQSEFIRYFNDFNEQFSFMELPFLELKNKVMKVVTNIETGRITREEVDKETDLTRFNKSHIANLIIEKKQYASPKLLKLAVAYRFCHEYYLKEDLSVPSLLEKYQKEELKLMYELVVTIIKETNEKLEFCKMDYIEEEREHGIMDYDIYGEDKFKSSN
ncbi:hypothetical protein [Paucisalibacillus sp. EB02]|uniref:hypothetical protein n=1 Tax=Paucisalibacillus sp. EB02 TaxID=1347087 RepID=UPI0004B6B8FF|nr:hypothetical protein [Paucisalibacillus sp. EB02]